MVAMEIQTRPQIFLGRYSKPGPLFQMVGEAVENRAIGRLVSNFCSRYFMCWFHTRNRYSRKIEHHIGQSISSSQLGHRQIIHAKTRLSIFSEKIGLDSKRDISWKSY